MYKKYKCPQNEKSYEYRRKKLKYFYWFRNEERQFRCIEQRRFRRKLNASTSNVDYDNCIVNIRPRDYKTYGYLTW